MADNKQDFVVSDRRRFGSEGDRRDDVRPEEEEKPAAATAASPAAPPAAPAPPAEQAPTEDAGEEAQEMAVPPTPEEELAQNEAYKASGKKLDELVGARMGAQEAYPEMSFAKVVESFYMSALIQMELCATRANRPGWTSSGHGKPSTR